LDAFEQFPAFAPVPPPSRPWLATPEFGLFYAITPTLQGQGYATEAAQAMVDYAFQHLRLKRVVATTTYDNTASMGVMRKLGMRIERNPFSEPPWLQIVGVLDNNAIAGTSGRN
jgi:hypothetical protein